MPTYSYKCKRCEYEFDAVQKITESSLCKCPQCSKNSLKKVIKSTNGFSLKGNGWFNKGGY